MDEKEDIKNELEDLPSNSQDATKENNSPPGIKGGEVQDPQEKNDNSTENNENQNADENEENNEDDNIAKKSKKLFFCNINRSSDLSTIFKVFRNYGEICDILILKDKNGHSLGRGFVEYDRDIDAEDALAKLNNTFVDGLKISIKYANPRVHKVSGVEYRQDPKKLDEDMRRKDYRLRQKTDNQARMPPQSIHNSHHRHRSYRDGSVDYPIPQNDYMSDYDPYDYDFDRGSDRRIQRDRGHDRVYRRDFIRERDRPPDRDRFPDRSYMRDFDRDRYRDRDRDRDQDIYSSRFHHHGHSQPPVGYIGQPPHRGVSAMPVMHSSYRQDLDDRSQSRPRRSNADDYDFDYDYDRDNDHNSHRRRMQPQNQAHVMRPSVQMSMPYPPAQVVYQSSVGRANSSPPSASSSEAASMIRVVPGQQQIDGQIASVRRYQDDVRLPPRGQPPPKQYQDDHQRYWKEDNYDQRGYRRRDRL